MPPTGSSNVKAVVLVDVYAWHEKYGDTSSPVQEAHKGDEITVSKDEFDRGFAMTPKGLAKKDSKEARLFLAGDLPANASHFAELNDDELRAVVSLRGVEGGDDMTRDELLGTVLAAPGSASPRP